MVDVNVRKFRSYEFNVSPYSLEFLKNWRGSYDGLLTQDIPNYFCFLDIANILKDNVGKASTRLRFFIFGFIQI